MALLKIFLVMLVLISGCYSPDIDDCSVTCTTDNECAGDQVCTAQGLCAGAASACEDNSAVDGGVTPHMIALQVKVDGDGKVSIDGIGDCEPSGSGPMGDTCMMQIAAGPVTITAIAADKPFERWTSLICAGQDASCHVTLTVNATVGAKFR